MINTEITGNDWRVIKKNTWMEVRPNTDDTLVLQFGKAADNLYMTLYFNDMAAVERLRAYLDTALEEHSRRHEVARFAAEPVERHADDDNCCGPRGFHCIGGHDGEDEPVPCPKYEAEVVRD